MGVDSVGKLTGDIPHKLSASREVQEEVSVQRVDAHEIQTKQKVTSTKFTKKTSHGSLNTDHGESSTRVVEESVEEVNGVNTTVRRITVDGLLVDEERISEKDGMVTEHSQVVKENVEAEDESAGDKDEL